MNLLQKCDKKKSKIFHDNRSKRVKLKQFSKFITNKVIQEKTKFEHEILEFSINRRFKNYRKRFVINDNTIEIEN